MWLPAIGQQRVHPTCRGLFHFHRRSLPSAKGSVTCCTAFPICPCHISMPHSPLQMLLKYMLLISMWQACMPRGCQRCTAAEYRMKHCQSPIAPCLVLAAAVAAAAAAPPQLPACHPQSSWQEVEAKMLTAWEWDRQVSSLLALQASASNTDARMTLHHGEPMHISAYDAAAQGSITVGALVVVSYPN